MTRYARAQGSKAANKREEEEATPWSVMVRGVRPPEQHRRREQAEKNPEDFDETDDIAFGDDGASDNEEEVDIVKIEESENEELDDAENIGDKHKPKILHEAETDVSEEIGKKKKKPRKQNKCLNCKKPGHLKRECPELTAERRKELSELFTMKIERKGQGTGRKKNKRKAAEALEGTSEATTNSENGSEQKKPKFEKAKKVLKDKTGQIVAEGEALFQGFRVKTEDAKRLRDLHKTLVKNKVKPDEIKEVLKRERRRAEKALSNSKKNVCYNCRQPGHMLADCPGVEGEQQPTSQKSYGASNQEILAGVCFKCGSAEHTSKDCRSKRKGEQAYQFATCFICHQTGHLAKACPDNPRGLYPKGGGCRFCGSVEHLKNDCPRKIQKDAKSEVRVGRTTFGDSLEDVPEVWTGGDEEKQKKKPKSEGHNKSKKVVKF